MITVASPPARPTHNRIEVVRVELEAGALIARVRLLDSAGNVVGGTGTTYAVEVNAGSGVGVRHAADGSFERFTKVDADITIAGAFGAFANTAGNFAARAAALETWLADASRGLLPT